MTELDEFRIDPLPTDDATCRSLIHDAIRDSNLEIAKSLPYFIDRLDIISDYDDYIPAAISILNFFTAAILEHERDSYAAILAAAFADPDLCADMMTLDFNTPILDFIDFID